MASSQTHHVVVSATSRRSWGQRNAQRCSLPTELRRATRGAVYVEHMVLLGAVALAVLGVVARYGEALHTLLDDTAHGIEGDGVMDLAEFSRGLPDPDALLEAFCREFLTAALGRTNVSFALDGLQDSQFSDLPDLGPLTGADGLALIEPPSDELAEGDSWGSPAADGASAPDSPSVPTFPDWFELDSSGELSEALGVDVLGVRDGLSNARQAR